MGAYTNDENGANAGIAYLIYGPVLGDIDLATADARLLGEAGDLAGHSVAGAGDVNGDGFDDLIVGADGHDGYRGAAYLIHGPVAGDIDLAMASARFLGEASSDAGWAVAAAGDINGDGLDDLLIGAKGLNGHDGGAYLIFGPAAGDVDLANADVRFLGATGSQLGISVASAGDVDGDGRIDVLLGAWAHDGSATSSGAAYLMLGGGL